MDKNGVLAIHPDIKQKSLFDHLIEDTRSLDLIAREIERAMRVCHNAHGRIESFVSKGKIIEKF